jgi:hypothetical protein
MAENNVPTNGEREKALDKPQSEVDNREASGREWDKLRREMIKHFRQSCREERAFRKEVATLFDQFEAKIMSRFDDYDEHTTQVFEKLGKEVAAKFDSLIEKEELWLETMRSQIEKAELWLKTRRSQKKT